MVHLCFMIQLHQITNKVLVHCILMHHPSYHRYSTKVGSCFISLISTRFLTTRTGLKQIRQLQLHRFYHRRSSGPRFSLPNNFIQRNLLPVYTGGAVATFIIGFPKSIHIGISHGFSPFFSFVVSLPLAFVLALGWPVLLCGDVILLILAK